MFTGIITAVGRIAEIHQLGGSSQHGIRITISCPIEYLADVTLGDSIALNGACMTVTSFCVTKGEFTIDMSAESLDKTSAWSVGAPLNLEKALRAHDRLGGHIVSGHVDGLGQVLSFEQRGESWELLVLAPPALARFIAYKGSITINGVSLTVNKVADTAEGCEFSINLIPHTIDNTALGTLQKGSTVNLEIDLIARYVERMLNNDASANTVASALQAGEPS
jgi:riboflavin synthase